MAMTREEIKVILDEKEHIEMKSGMSNHLKSKHNNVYLNIIENTHYLEENSKFSERTFHIKNDMFDYPTCKMCGVQLKYNDNRSSYPIYCSASCGSNDPIVKKKVIESNLKTYGCEYGLQNKEVQKKSEITILERFGVKNVMQNKSIQEKVKQTCLENHGVEYSGQSKEIQEKKKQTCLKTYGYECSLCNKEVQEKIKCTNIKIYGFEYPMQSKEIQEKVKCTNLKNRGCEYILHSDELNKMQYEKQSKMVEDSLYSMDLKLLNNYTNSIGLNIFKCLKCGEEFESCWFNVQHGKRCPCCYPTIFGSSKQEREISEFIKFVMLENIEIIENDRNTIINENTNRYLELDICIPEKKIAIEFNGIYWHTDIYKDKDYHLLKTELCKEKGIRLIHIFEDEWKYKKDIVKSKLKQILGINNFNRIYAKKCIIKEIDCEIKNEFLDKFHIEGIDDSDINLGAFYQDKLISIMTFLKSDKVCELNSFCTNSDYHIPGIAMKLLSYFKKNYEWKEIYSYADVRWSIGRLNNQLGFELIYITTPNYRYAKDCKRMHRTAFENYIGESKSVLEAKDQLPKIYDCGNLIYKMINI